MTEKRFELVDIGFVYDNDKLIGMKEIVDLLNAFNDENEQLKKLLECSREEANDYCEELMGKDEFIRLYKSQRDDAIKENEQLKQELVEFKKWEKHIGDVKREDLDRVFNMSIYEIAEAFEYYKERIKKLEKELQE